MKDEIFIYFCKCMYNVYGIPVRVYKDDKIQIKYELVSLNGYLDPLVTDLLYKQFAEQNNPYYVLQTANLLTYGFIRNKGSRLSVLIGPSRSTQVRREAFLEEALARAPNNPLPEHISRSLELYLNAIPIMQLGRFIYILASIFAVAQEEIIQPDKMQIATPVQKYDKTLHSSVLKHFENVINGDIPKFNYYDAEKRMLQFIKNGMSEPLTRIWQEATPKFASLPNNAETLRAEKDRLLVGIGIVTDAVLDCGLNDDDVFRQRTLYIRKAEDCRSVMEVVNLRFNMMMDFCRRIEEGKRRTTTAPLANYAIKFISDNIDKKISLQEIADALHVSKSYLCAEFSKSMGVGLFHYIQEQKIERAKQFLLLTDKPLVEISEILSFSSQSYFQKVFKQITGTTPKEFREKGIREIQ